MGMDEVRNEICKKYCIWLKDFLKDDLIEFKLNIYKIILNVYINEKILKY